MTPQTRPVPHKAGSGGQLGETADNPRLVQCWMLVGAATRDQELTLGDVATLWAILDRLNDESVSWPGYGRLAEDTGFHRATVARAISKLVERGYLECESGGPGKSNRYRPSSRTDATGTSRKDATSREDAGSRTDATGVVACVRLGVVAPVRPEPASLNLLKEPASKERARKQEKVDLPTWLPAPVWQTWKGHRGKKFSRKAQGLALRKLERLRAEGHDPAKLIELAIESDWVSFYPRESTKAAGTAVGMVERDPRTDAEIDAANEAELARFNFGAAA